ncbi:MAG: hypothetical protein P8P98_06375 [Emcibacteraceae bacterium]|nr:hypothetical protein [Emcibacteraceae bacterium]MDG1995313.1 hypothetical protein [Emcibacteraceae bacterium]
MQAPSQQKNYFHTMINVGLVAFLIIVATIGMRSLTYTGDISISGLQGDKPVFENVMVCAIGQCVFL